MELIPEIRAQERLEEAAVAVMPRLSRSARADILRAWKMLAFPGIGPMPEIMHEQAWDTLRNLVRVRG